MSELTPEQRARRAVAERVREYAECPGQDPDYVGILRSIADEVERGDAWAELARAVLFGVLGTVDSYDCEGCDRVGEDIRALLKADARRVAALKAREGVGECCATCSTAPGCPMDDRTTPPDGFSLSHDYGRWIAYLECKSHDNPSDALADAWKAVDVHTAPLRAEVAKLQEENKQLQAIADVVASPAGTASAAYTGPENVLVAALQQRDRAERECERLRAELEQERIRLAACGVAAHGGDSAAVEPGSWADSDSLRATLRLQAKLAACRELAPRWESKAARTKCIVGGEFQKAAYGHASGVSDCAAELRRALGEDG